MKTLYTEIKTYEFHWFFRKRVISRINYSKNIELPNETVLSNLYVNTNYRKDGIATKLIEQAEKQSGANVFYLKVRKNTWILDWYKRLGYKELKNSTRRYVWLIKTIE